MRELFKAYDEKVLKSKPLVWITGLHWLFPLAILLCLLSYSFGWCMPYSVNLTRQEVEGFIFPVAWITGVCVVILLVIFFIRQIRFDALRVHHNLPYKKPYLHFFIFLITLSSITAIPHLASLGGLHKCRYSIDESVVRSDLAVLDNGVAHFVLDQKKIFYSQAQYDNLPLGLRQMAVEHHNDADQAIYKSGRYTLPLYNLIGDSIYFSRKKMNHYSRSRNIEALSLEDAKVEIEEFKKVAYKYGGRFKDLTPREHIDQMLLFIQQGSVLNFNDNNQTYNTIMNHDELRQHYSLHDDILDAGDSLFYAGPWKFWKYYLLLPFLLSLLLYVLCAVKLMDFGWALLVGSLTFVFGGILTGLSIALGLISNSHNELEWFWLVLITAFLLTYLFIIHFSALRSVIKRAFAIALHILTPVIFWFYWILGDELHEVYNVDFGTDHYEILDENSYYALGYSLLLVICLISISLFNRHYTKQYVHPKS